MGLEMANKVNMTLFGRCSGQHYLIYSGVNRVNTKEVNVHTA
jgi:FdhD protein